MFEWTDNQPDVSVRDSEYARLLGYPQGHILKDRPLELAEQTKAWFAKHGKPWLYLRESHSLKLGEDAQVLIDGITFNSKKLHQFLKDSKSHSVIIAAVSAGPECEEKAGVLWHEKKPDEYFFMEMLGSAVVEHLISHAGGKMCSWADEQGMVALPHYSPGYPEWDVSEQTQLLNLIKSGTNSKELKHLVTLHSGMLNPKKSLLAVFGITKHKTQGVGSLIPCETCSLQGCDYRRAAYSLEMEAIENLKPKDEETAVVNETSPLQLNAKYTISKKALRKWSDQLLDLEFLENNSVRARFHYEGTTCANLGHPIKFNYDITLSGPSDRYEILSMDCAPADDDTGHKQMCEYLKNPEGLMNSIADEKPLLGKKLDSVLSWEPQSSSSGCYCGIGRRNHKWTIVYETLHFALAQKQLQGQENPT